ncbi:MAG: hypothetical protein ABL984_17470, partial [Pyrinomonadaceae bacterium]
VVEVHEATGFDAADRLHGAVDATGRELAHSGHHASRPALCQGGSARYVTTEALLPAIAAAHKHLNQQADAGGSNK